MTIRDLEQKTMEAVDILSLKSAVAHSTVISGPGREQFHVYDSYLWGRLFVVRYSLDQAKSRVRVRNVGLS